jgi:hypothetical protein
MDANVVGYNTKRRPMYIPTGDEIPANSSSKHFSSACQVDGKHVCSQLLHHHHQCTCREYGNVKVRSEHPTFGGFYRKVLPVNIPLQHRAVESTEARQYVLPILHSTTSSFYFVLNVDKESTTFNPSFLSNE